MEELALDNRVVLTSAIDEAIQEVDILMNTEQTELIGVPNFGVYLDQFLWSLTPTTTEVTKYIRQKIQDFCPTVQQFNWDVSCEHYKGEIRSIYIVDIYIVDDTTNEITHRKYQYQ